MSPLELCKNIRLNIMATRGHNFHLGEFYSESMVIQHRLAKHSGVDHDDFDVIVVDYFETTNRGAAYYHALVHFNHGCVHVKVGERSSVTEVTLIKNAFSLSENENKDLIDRTVDVVVQSIAKGFPVRTAVTALNRFFTNQRSTGFDLLSLIETPVLATA